MWRLLDTRAVLPVELRVAEKCQYPLLLPLDVAAVALSVTLERYVAAQSMLK
jgi:hypothetical protein